MNEIDLADEIAAFMKQRAKLAENPERPWVVFADAALKGSFPSFEDAVNFAMEQFPNGRFLIRDIKAEEPTVPLVFAAA